MTVTKPKQAGGTVIPPKPTEGWMRHELEANGVRALGVKLSVADLVRMLRALGYDVE